MICYKFNFSINRLVSSAAAVPRVKNFINGVFEDSKTTQFIDLSDPATQKLLCQGKFNSFIPYKLNILILYCTSFISISIS